jgi:hypothetical protein
MQTLQACFKGLRKEIRHLIRYAVIDLRRLKYGKALLRMFIKTPNVALKSILRSATGDKASTTLPIDLSIPKGEKTGRLMSSYVPMISGPIALAIMQEALRRTPNHKAAGPDGVPGLVLEHMPPSYHEGLHLLFYVLAIYNGD